MAQARARGQSRAKGPKRSARTPKYVYGFANGEAEGRKPGAPERPLLVSVRSGARASMPGMMDTVLNLGLNDKTVDGLARWTKNERFAWDCYRRFITIFGDVVLGIDRRALDPLPGATKRRAAATADGD